MVFYDTKLLSQCIVFAGSAFFLVVFMSAIFPLLVLWSLAGLIVPVALHLRGLDVLNAILVLPFVCINEIRHIIVYGDDLRPNEHSILILNHVSFADPLLMFSLVARQSGIGVGRLRVLAKAEIASYGPWGVAMSLLGYIFLNRSWKEDDNNLRIGLRRLFNSRTPRCLISCPEGRRLTPNRLLMAQEFARNRFLHVPDHTLIPRVKGFRRCLEEGFRLDAIYDVTVAYPKGPLSFWGWMCGEDEVHIKVKRLPIRECPPSNQIELIDAFLYDLWKKKDFELKEFKKEGQFMKRRFLNPLSLQLLLLNLYWALFGALKPQRKKE